MVPRDFRKPLCIAAGWFTLVVAVLWETASVFSIGVYNCAWNFLNIQSGVSTWNMFYITYFMGGCKSLSDASAIGFVFSPPSSAAKSLQIWMWICTILTSLWIPACILLIVAVTNEVRGKAGAALYYPWIGLTAALVLVDLAGTIYHLVDISSTTTVDKYATFIGSSDWSTLTNGLSSDNIVPWLPSLYITLYFCRFLVFWILNLYFVLTVYRASSAVSLYKAKYLQSTAMAEEKRKTWKDSFFQGPDPREIEHQQVNIIRRPQLSNIDDQEQQVEMREINPPRSPVVVHRGQPTEQRPTTSSEAVSELPSRHSPVRYKVDEFGIPIEELHSSEPREISYNENEGHLPRSPLIQPVGYPFDYTGRPLSKPQTYSERRQDSAPPMASGVEVPAELNRNLPFSYMAGDQPQLRKKPLSRNNSKAEYPVIPHPDYTIVDRRSSVLEYIPHRFKLPSSDQPVQRTNSFRYDPPITQRSPTIPKKKAPAVPPKKPQGYPRAHLKSKQQIFEENSRDPESSRYKPKEPVQNQQQQKDR